MRNNWNLTLLSGMLGLVILTTACSGLFDVTDPTLIRDEDVQNKTGANAQRLQALSALSSSMQQALPINAIFSDEREYDAETLLLGNSSLALDTRDIQTSVNSDPTLTALTMAIAQISIVLPNIRANADTAVRNDYLAQLYALRGWVIIQMAEDLCPGFPINDIWDGVSHYSKPFSTDSALRYAVATLDTALAAGRDSAQFINLARVLKGRALIDLGEYDAARNAVASVPTNFFYRSPAPTGASFAAGFGANNYSIAVGDGEGGVGLRYASARDPRIPVIFKMMRRSSTGDIRRDSLFDQSIYVRTYPANAPVQIGTGIEARLIEAEAALNAGDSITWLNKLNLVRQTAITPALPPLNDPGPTTRVDTLFKERAFWMYLTGHRLGDMRRLVRRYGRPVASVFAQGVHPTSGVYSESTSIPFNFEAAAKYNPNITRGCWPEP